MPAYLRAGLFHIDITVQPQLAVPVLSKVAGINCFFHIAALSLLQMP